MIKQLILGVAILAAPLKAHAIDQYNFATRSFLYSSVAADLASTWRKGRIETNPILGQSKTRQASLAIGSALGADLIASRITNRKLSHIVRLAVGSIHWTAAAHNRSIK